MQDTHPALVSGQGARVVVHSQDTLPHPTADGYDVPAEFSVTIGVSARENVRVSQPHGNCTSSDHRPPSEMSHTSRTSPRNYRSALYCTHVHILLYDLVSIQPPHGHHTRSSPYVTLIKPSSSLKVTHRSFLHLIFGTSSLHHSEFLIRIIHPPLSDLHLNMPV